MVEAETGHHLWADRYDRNVADLFEVQDEIVDRVAGAIEPEILRTETLRARDKTPESLTAWDLIFRGMWHFYQVTPDHHLRAREAFRKAIQAAPEVAEGHTGSADALPGCSSTDGATTKKPTPTKDGRRHCAPLVWRPPILTRTMR